MSGRSEQVARLLAFAALGAFVAVHWAGIVEPAPVGRLLAALAVACAGAAGLVAIERLVTARLRALLLAGAVAGATLLAALAAGGIPPALLWPPGWSELAANVDIGLAGLAGDIDYPYGEVNAWSRLVLVAVGPLVLVAAATATFWPAAEAARRRLRVLGLALLVGLYATVAAVTSLEAPALRGAALLVLVAAWLWLPSLRRRDAIVATALIAGAGALAVPAAAQLRADDPWLDYRNWTLRSAEGTTYEWEHSYGPIDWPRDGRQILSVASEEPHYWKTAVLDRFDGIRWTRSEEASAGARDVSPGGPELLPPGGDPKWVKEFVVTIADLESELVPAAGVPLTIQGVDEVVSAPDGTTITRAEPLGRDDSYLVRAYVPDPTADELREAPASYPDELVNYTRIGLPAGSANGDPGLPAETVTVPLRALALRETMTLSPEAEARILNSPYGGMFELAHELTADQPTTYDAVRAVQDHLRNGYDYSEFPPRRAHPLPAFLFVDERGYCQQFSGAMALMLRMAGIPTRVAGGFAPGTRNDDGDRFRVEDFDAHAWVEVYFSGVGWVAFDPTPPAAPLSSQQIPGFPTAELESAAAPQDDEPEEQAVPPVPVPGAGGGTGAPNLTALLAAPGALAALALVGLALVAIRSRRHRRLPPQAAAEAQLGELAQALERLGWRTSGGTTLLGIERALTATRRRAAARYVNRVRLGRYGTETAKPPSLAARRALRRELAAALGLRGRLRALIAIPPGGPRIPRRP